MNNELNREINLKSILAFTLPSIFMMVVMSLYTIVDGIFVSRLINTNAFSAVNIIYPLMSIVIGLGTMFGTGTTAIVSENSEKEDKKRQTRSFTFIILFTIGLGIAFSVVSCLFLGDIIHLLGANDAVFGLLPRICAADYSVSALQPSAGAVPEPFVANGKLGTGLFGDPGQRSYQCFSGLLLYCSLQYGCSRRRRCNRDRLLYCRSLRTVLFRTPQEAPLHFVKPPLPCRLLCAHDQRLV